MKKINKNHEKQSLAILFGFFWGEIGKSMVKRLDMPMLCMYLTRALDMFYALPNTALYHSFIPSIEVLYRYTSALLARLCLSLSVISPLKHQFFKRYILCLIL